MALSFLLLALSFLFRKSKIFSIIILLYCWILFGFNSHNGDYVAYKLMYDEINSLDSIFSYEAGYKVFMLVVKKMGFDFQDFMKIISFVILSILGMFTLKFSKFPAIFLSVFLIIFLPIEYVLLRNFFAFSIVLTAIYYFLQNNNRKILLYGTLIASTVHISSFFYLLIFFSTSNLKIGIQKITVYIITGLIAFIFLNNIIISTFLTDVGGRSEIYLNRFPQFVLYSGFQIVNFIIIRWYFLNNNNIQPKYKDFLLSMNMFLLFLIIIYFNYAIFIRIFMNLSLINILFMVNSVALFKKYGLIRLGTLIIYLMFFFFVFVYPVQEDSLIPLYKNNLIIK